jgi:hypothetical protein
MVPYKESVTSTNILNVKLISVQIYHEFMYSNKSQITGHRRRWTCEKFIDDNRRWTCEKFIDDNRRWTCEKFIDDNRRWTYEKFIDDYRRWHMSIFYCHL